MQFIGLTYPPMPMFLCDLRLRATSAIFQTRQGDFVFWKSSPKWDPTAFFLSYHIFSCTMFMHWLKLQTVLQCKFWEILKQLKMWRFQPQWMAKTQSCLACLAIWQWMDQHLRNFGNTSLPLDTLSDSIKLYSQVNTQASHVDSVMVDQLS